MTAVLVSAVFIGLAGRSSANTGGWDTFGYYWTDSNTPGDQVIFDWVDISSTGYDTGLDGDDQCTDAIDIGFPFSFYGSSYSSVYVETNGLMSFAGYTTDYSNNPIPSTNTPDAFVAPYWDDLEVDSYYGGAVYYQTLGTSPNMQFVVEWYQVTLLGDSSEMTFEVILNETGEIWIQYLSMSGVTGSGATVGIESPDGSAGSQYSYFTASLSDGLAVRFEMGPIGFGYPQSGIGYPGETLEYGLTIYNNRDVSDIFALTIESTYGWSVTVCDAYGAPLPDSDFDSTPDTGIMPADSGMDIIVQVVIPASPAEQTEYTTVVATSSVNALDYAEVTLVSEVYAAWFTPPHSDYGYDSDLDGLYDLMVIDASIEVTFDGTYYLYADLYDSLYNLIDYGSWGYVLSSGANVVSAYFDGPTIFAFGTDGVYYVDLNLYDTSTYLGYSYHYTASYLCSEFDPPATYFDPPNSDYGLDTGADGLYDFLVVDLGVSSSVEGTYDMDISLYDSGMNYLAGLTISADIAIGWQTVEFQFDGRLLNSLGLSGEYNVIANIYSDPWTVMDVEYYTTGSYSYDQFQPPGASFSPPHSERTVDMNGDSYYEYLVVEVQVDVTEAGTYMIYGDLYDDYGYWVTAAYNDTYLDVGLQTVDLYFSGSDIYNSYGDPYEVDLILYDALSSPIDYDTYYTGTYYYYQFSTSVAWFTPPHSDAGLDVNGNTFYDWLVVYVSVYVTVEGDYELDAYLYDPYGAYILDVYNTTYLYTGAQTVEIWFQGVDIYNTGESGSFEVYLYLYYDWYTQDSDVYYTSIYSYDEFEPPGAYFSPPHSDYGYDEDLNGQYDYMIVQVSLGVTVSGTYYVDGDLYDSLGNYVTYYYVGSSLTAGTATVDLYFWGEYIYANGVDGTFTVYLYLYDASWNSIDYDTYTTSSYLYDEFDPPAACFAPPHSDAGVDTDGDSLFEYLMVTVNIEVHVSGYYYVYSYLYTDWDYITWTENYTYLDAGMDSVVLMYPTWTINALAYDGEMYVYLDIYSDSGTWLDDDEYVTSTYLHTEFDDDMPSIESVWTSVAPTIDGVISDGEWDSAAVVDLSADPDNELAAYLLVMNNGTQLFIAYDVVGDTWDDYSDVVSMGFDNGNDAALVDGSEDQFIVYSYPGDAYHYQYDSFWDDWEYDCSFDPLLTDHEGLACGYGFGPSPMEATDHRTFEISIPLALLGVSAGDTLGFVAASEYEPGVFDDYWYDESYWPVYNPDVYTQALYGDLVLAAAVPETTATLDGTLGSGGWYTSDVTVTLDATGGDGGVDYTMYSVDGGSWTTYTSPFAVSAEGVSAVEFYSVDMVGSFEDVKSVDVSIDTVAPSTTYTLDGYTVTLTSSDASSGVDGTWYSIDGGSWTAYTAPFTLTGSGGHTVEYYSVDVAGNEEAVGSLSVSAETDPPVTGASFSGTEGLTNWYVSDIEVTLTADDGDGSGVDVTYYRINGGSWRTYSAPFSITEDGTHTVEFYSVDNAGNEEAAQTADVKLDATLPTATASVVGSEVTLTGSDDTSGLSMIVYRIDGGDWQIYSGSFVVEGSGNHTVEYFAADNAGNEGEVQTLAVEGSGGGISALLIGALVGVAVLAAVGLLLFLVLRKKRGQQQVPPPPEMMPPPPPMQ